MFGPSVSEVYNIGRLSFHPIPCGSRDMLQDERSLHIDEGQNVLASGGVCARPQARKLYKAVVSKFLVSQARPHRIEHKTQLFFY